MDYTENSSLLLSGIFISAMKAVFQLSEIQNEFLGNHRKGECLLERLFSILKACGPTEQFVGPFCIVSGLVKQAACGRWVLFCAGVGRFMRGKHPLLVHNRRGLLPFLF
ncbi:hypothetical protein [Bilophila sp.]|mgnify:CR=1 FL=1|uniref:hypothetical protein n=1 Tax=Bilophila sp. TaxID=1929485 RepID=UPI003076DDFB